MKRRFDGQGSEELGADAPKGLVNCSERLVRSAPLSLPGSERPLVLCGRIDAVVACDDDTVAIVDFKTSEPSMPNLAAYTRQLHAYATALELPAAGQSVSVSAMGLLCFTPERFDVDARQGGLVGHLTWTEVEPDRQAFAHLLTEVVAVLEQPTAPDAQTTCPWCRWAAHPDVAA